MPTLGARRYGHVRTVRRKALCQSRSDSAAGTRDECSTTLESSRHQATFLLVTNSSMHSPM